MTNRFAWLGKITPENADKNISDIAKGWYALAGLQAVLLAVIAWSTGVLDADLLDPLVPLIGGYFLGRRKSRAVAVTLMAYALGTAATTIANKLDLYGHGGTNVLLALFVLLWGWRGIRATWIHHQARGNPVAWARVAAVSGAGATCAVLVFLVVVVGAVVADWDLEGALFGVAVLLAPLAGLILVMAPLTRRYPFVAAEPAAA